MARQPTTDWDACPEPDPLIRLACPDVPTDWRYYRLRLTPAEARRLRLFAAACARQVWDWLPTDARSAVLISERFADGRAIEEDLRAAAVPVDHGAFTFQAHARNAAAWASAAILGAGFLSTGGEPLVWDAPQAARDAAKALATRAAGPSPRRPTDPRWHATWGKAFTAARATQADFLRDIFPPPGHTPRLDPRWLTSTVRELARGMDATGDFSLTPILADALQDAGCDDPVVLARCRAAGPHVRGNWVVDAILGSPPAHRSP